LWERVGVRGEELTRIEASVGAAEAVD